MVAEGKDPRLALEQIAGIGKKIEIPEKEKNFGQLLEEALESSCHGVKFTFGINSLNAILGGVDQSEIVTIGGYTSQGKTSLAIQLCKDFCEKEWRVLYCTSEMSEIETAKRFLANLQRKNLMDFRKGIFKEGEIESIRKESQKITQNWKLTIAKVFTVADIRNLVNKHEPQILFIDYLQNLYRENEWNDYQRITHDMQDIQVLTRENNLATFVLSQLSRNKEEIREPVITDLKGSGAIEEKSHIVLFVYWKNRLKQTVEIRKGQEPPEELKISVAKNRDGTIGHTKVDYYPEFSKITSQGKYTQGVLS